MFSINAATIDDIPIINSLATSIWPQAYGQILPDGQVEYMLDLIYSPRALKRQMNENKQAFFIAHHGEMAIGFTSIAVRSAEVLKLHKLYVLRERQGTGAGKALLNHVIVEALAKKASVLMLNVNRQNDRAINFYKKNGFKTIGVEDIDIGAGFEMNDFVMNRIL